MKTNKLAHTSINKICRYCNATKPVEEFRVRGSPKSNSLGSCLICFKRRRQEQYKEYDKQRNEKRRTQWREDPELRERNSIAARKYRIKNKIVLAEKTKVRHQQLRQTIIEKYGHKCVCCGEAKFEFLAIDHVNNDGSEERKHMSNSKMYRKLRDTEDLLAEYQILCHNCSSAKGYYGYCPHKKE